MFENLIKLSASFCNFDTWKSYNYDYFGMEELNFESILYTTIYAIMYKSRAKIGAPII